VEAASALPRALPPVAAPGWHWLATELRGRRARACGALTACRPCSPARPPGCRTGAARSPRSSPPGRRTREYRPIYWQPPPPVL